MSWTNCFKNLGAAVLLPLLISGCGDERGERLTITDSGQDLSIGRMRVSIWPEYDDRSVLAIYDGKLDGASSFPLKTSFLVPKGAVINDACSLSVEGQHFCQLYKTIDRGAFAEVRLLLPYPNFYLSFHTPQIDTEAERREFDYRIKANHAIKTMNVDIQQPLRATGFRISPPGNAATSQAEGKLSMIRGFTHFGYTLADISEGQESTFKIAYLKNDPNPSVDIKYASMTGPRIWSSPYEAQKNVRTVIYILFGTGTFGVLIVAMWFVRLRKTKKHGTLA
jgi:hypothetical protein